jgi:Sigma-70 region 2
MLGSLGEAEDAVQEAWIHAERADSGDVANLEGWLTTIVARVCLDMLRTRKSRREEPLAVDQAIATAGPEQEAVLADSVGLAMLVVLDTLPPAERVAFVLHDMFGLPFGAEAVAMSALAGARRSAHVGLALINGTPGIVLAPGGRLVLALAFTIPDDRITRIEVIADPDRLSQLDLAVLG